MNIQKIKERIKKLLAMSQDSSSPHEAAIAAGRVQKLMADYNLEMADLIAQELNDEDNIIEFRVNIRYKRIPSYIGWIEVAVAKAFNCEVKGGGEKKDGHYYNQTIFYGYKTDVEVASWLCSYICAQLERMAKQVKVPEPYASLGLGRRYMADWRKGAANEICDRVKNFYGTGSSQEAQDQEVEKPASSINQQALSIKQQTLVTLKKDAIEKKFGRFSYGTSKTYRYTHDGMSAGRQAAESIKISRDIQKKNIALPHLQ